MIEAAASEARIIEVLKKQPGMGVMALATATASKKSTTAERLKRLREKGLVEAAESGGWSAAEGLTQEEIADLSRTASATLRHG